MKLLKISKLFTKIGASLMFLAWWPACAPADQTNPAAEGFNIEKSDNQAIIIVDQVMTAMGGYEAWQQTRYLQWTFLGNSRDWIWDKQTGDFRVNSKRDSLLMVGNLYTNDGKVIQKGKLLSDSIERTQMLKLAKSLWNNDSYWLIMPFKLKDSGVTLKFLGEKDTDKGKPANVLEVTFEKVGDTPNNMYHVYVDKTTNLVSQWDYFVNNTDSIPKMSTSWENYQPMKTGILLSNERNAIKTGNIRKLENVAVLDAPPPGTFSIE